jgi:hypothetical protein
VSSVGFSRNYISTGKHGVWSRLPRRFPCRIGGVKWN